MTIEKATEKELINKSIYLVLDEGLISAIYFADGNTDNGNEWVEMAWNGNEEKLLKKLQKKYDVNQVFVITAQCFSNLFAESFKSAKKMSSLILEKKMTDEIKSWGLLANEWNIQKGQGKFQGTSSSSKIQLQSERGPIKSKSFLTTFLNGIQK